MPVSNTTFLVVKRKNNMEIKQKILYEYYFDIDGTLNDFQFGAPWQLLFIPGYFENRPEHINVIKTIKELYKMQIKGFPLRIYIISKYLTHHKYAISEKHNWINKILPEIPPENRILLKTEEDKTDFVKISHRTVLIDDYTENLKKWKDKGGRIIKMSTDRADRIKEAKSGKWPACISPDQSPSELTEIILSYQLYEMLYGDKNLLIP